MSKWRYTIDSKPEYAGYSTLWRIVVLRGTKRKSWTSDERWVSSQNNERCCPSQQ